MKAKIFAKLKQEYSSLGLGDELLMSLAEALAAPGLVTDENIDAVVAHQRKYLENLQKVNDKRVTDALDKERKKHAEEALKKEREAAAEAERLKAETEKEKEVKEKEKEAEIKPHMEENPQLAQLFHQLEEMKRKADEREQQQAELLKGLVESRSELEKQVKSLSDENTAAKKAAVAAERKAKIEAKAKELGVPDWRISEGFIIADDATDEAITETLTKVANNINTNLLPGNRGAFPLGSSEPSKDELASFAASLVK